jgi:type IX secretion system PorP/SprF family membrane protein
MRKALTLLVLHAALFSGVALAQQLPQLSQYSLHDYIYNPAVAGSRTWFELRSAHRYQWVGIQDAPRTFLLSGSTPLATNMGVGAYLFTDIVGPTRRTGFQASYAYHLQLNDELKLSLSASLGMVQFLIDGSKIDLREQDDPALDDQLRGEILPDAKFAFYLYHPKFWFGACAPQLIGNRISFFADKGNSLSELSRHYYAMGGYRHRFGEDWRLEPQFLVKYVDPAPPKIDASLVVHYQDMVWLGGSWRSGDAFAVMVGYWLKKSFQFGYSYDLTTTGLQQYAQGTHEVTLGLTFDKAAKD